MSKLPLILSAALISVAPVGIAAAHAADARVTLSTRGVDFADPAQVKAFYERVTHAARAVCNGDTMTPWGIKEGEACRSQFISDAVNKVNAPLLTAMSNPDPRKASAYASDDR